MRRTKGFVTDDNSTIRGSQEVTHGDNALPDYMEDPSQTGSSQYEPFNFQPKHHSGNTFSIPPETAGIGPTLNGEVLQDLVEVRNELKSMKEANAKAFREVQDMLQQALEKNSEETRKA